MLSTIKRLKTAYSFYNFFHRKQLQHNLPLFKKYGIRKNYYSPLSSKDFAHLPEDEGMNKTDMQALQQTVFFNRLNEENKANALAFDENGFLIIRNFLSEEEVDAVNNEIEQLQKNGTIKYNSVNKLMFAFHHSQLLRDIADDASLKDFLGPLVTGEVVLFSSINFIMGSQQPTHSDSIHMTTYPLGGLLGVWIALDDITEDNGPLHYYPGSHKLPYYLNSDYDNEGTKWLLGDKTYKAYEEMIARKIAEKGIKKQIFTAKKGDMIVWHANLFHGGEPHTDKSKTRKSMVFHYFRKGSVCYHEITQRPALIRMK